MIVKVDDTSVVKIDPSECEDAANEGKQLDCGDVSSDDDAGKWCPTFLSI